MNQGSTSGQSKAQSVTWVGSKFPHFDVPYFTECGPVVLGCYGGNISAGARKNEDAALVWCDPAGAWEFAMVLDAHHSSQSAELIIRTLSIEHDSLVRILNLPIQESFTNLSSHLIGRFQSPAFRARCQYTKGETACLMAARKDNFLWWLSIGDCCLYLFHPELARFGQFALNQRNYYEWVGASNSFSLPVACFTSGVRELRQGKNMILLTTDGAVEAGSRHFEDPKTLYQTFTAQNLDPKASILKALEDVHTAKGVDSATMIAWVHNSDRAGLQPSKPR